MSEFLHPISKSELLKLVHVTHAADNWSLLEVMAFLKEMECTSGLQFKAPLFSIFSVEHSYPAGLLLCCCCGRSTKNALKSHPYLSLGGIAH